MSSPFEGGDIAVVHMLNVGLLGSRDVILTDVCLLAQSQCLLELVGETGNALVRHRFGAREEWVRGIALLTDNTHLVFVTEPSDSVANAGKVGVNGDAASRRPFEQRQT